MLVPPLVQRNLSFTSKLHPNFLKSNTILDEAIPDQVGLQYSTTTLSSSSHTHTGGKRDQRYTILPNKNEDKAGRKLCSDIRYIEIHAVSRRQARHCGIISTCFCHTSIPNVNCLVVSLFGLTSLRSLHRSGKRFLPFEPTLYIH